MSFSVSIGRREQPRVVEAAAAHPAAAVLGPARMAAPVAAALALRLAARSGAACALVAAGERMAGPRLPASGPAAGAARALGARDITAVASGRLVRAQLDDLIGFGRAAAVVDGPAVLVVSWPRTPELDTLLRALDGLAACGGASSYSELAEASLRELGPPVTRVAPVRAPLAAAWALAGLGAPAPLGAAVEAVRLGVPA